MEFDNPKNDLRYVVREYPLGKDAFVLSCLYETWDSEGPLEEYTIKETPVISISVKKAMHGDKDAQASIISLIQKYPLEQNYSKNAPFLLLNNDPQKGIAINTHYCGRTATEYGMVISLKQTIVRYDNERYFILSVKNPEQGRNSCVKHIYGFFRLENGKFFVEDYPLFIAKISLKKHTLEKEMSILNKQNQLLRNALGPYTVADGMGVVKDLLRRRKAVRTKSTALIPTLGSSTIKKKPNPFAIQVALRDLFSLLWHIAIFNELGCHGDLNSGNVMCTPEGEWALIDFGLAQLYEDTPDMEYPPYEHIPPEMVFGGSYRSCDSYAFANIFGKYLALNTFHQLHCHGNDQGKSKDFLDNFSQLSKFTYNASGKQLEEREKKAFYTKPFPLMVRFLDDNLDQFFQFSLKDDIALAKKQYGILRHHYLNALLEYYDLNLQLEKANSIQAADKIKKSLGNTHSDLETYTRKLIEFVFRNKPNNSLEKNLSTTIKEYTDNLLLDLHGFLHKMTGNEDLIRLYRDYTSFYVAVDKYNYKDNHPLLRARHIKYCELKREYEKVCKDPLRLTPKEGLFEFYLLLQKYCLPEEMKFFTLRMLQFLRVASNVPLQYQELSSRMQNKNSQGPIVFPVTIRDLPEIKFSLTKETFLPRFFSISPDKKPLPSPEPALAEMSGNVMRNRSYG